MADLILGPIDLQRWKKRLNKSDSDFNTIKLVPTKKGGKKTYELLASDYLVSPKYPGVKITLEYDMVKMGES